MTLLRGSESSLFVTGGGTAGHIYAGISVADRWREVFPKSRICFVGAKGGMEERLVARTPYPLRLVPMGAWNGMSGLKRLKTALQIPWSLSLAGIWLIRERPSAVIGVGGYASFPLVLSAAFLGWLWGCKVTILEQNVLPGLTNRVLGFFSRRVYSAFPGAESVFGEQKVLVTGNPIRSNMKRLASSGRSPFTVFIFGGSQGAMGINSLVLDALDPLKKSGLKFKLIHQTGDKDFERVVSGYQSASVDGRVEKFIYDMVETYAQADLLICRAGASTLAEIATVGRAAILVPLVSKDRHQVFNAEYFVRSGAAEMVLQGETRGNDLAQLIIEIARDPMRIGTMEEKVVRFSQPGAVHRIVADLSGGGSG